MLPDGFVASETQQGQRTGQYARLRVIAKERKERKEEKHFEKTQKYYSIAHALAHIKNVGLEACVG